MVITVVCNRLNLYFILGSCNLAEPGYLCLIFYSRFLRIFYKIMLSLNCCLVAQLCLTLCNPVDCSTPGFPVLHQLPDLAQTHVHRFSDGHPTISSSVIPFFHLQSFPASEFFPLSQFFASGGQNIGISASALVLPMNIQD